MGKNKNNPDLLLMYYREITKSNHLHFGYWEKGDPLDMEHLKKAQERYMEKFMTFIPKGVKTILDVGAGVGGNALNLTKKGYKVVSLSPDPLLKIEFEKNTNNKIPYILTKFEDYKTEDKYDMVLMSESLQYINPSAGLDKCYEVLNKNGFFLGIDYFKPEGVAGGIMMAGHYQKAYLDLAEKKGFRLINSEDITENVAPSFDFMSDLYSSYLIPSFKVIARFINLYIPFFYKILRALFKKKLYDLIEKSNISGEKFAKNRRYMIYLFQKK